MNARKKYSRMYEFNRRQEAARRIHSYYKDQCRRFRRLRLSPEAIISVINGQYAEYEEFKQANEDMFNRYMDCLVSSLHSGKIVELPQDTVEVMVPHFVLGTRNPSRFA